MEENASKPTTDPVDFEPTLTVTPEPIKYTLAGSCTVARYVCSDDGYPDRILVNGEESDSKAMIAAMGQAAGRRITFGKDRKVKKGAE